MASEFTGIKVVSTDTKGLNMNEESIKVAFATDDLEWINAHFGKSGQFAVYNVSKDGFELDEILKIKDEELTGQQDKNDQIAQIIAAKGIAILYLESIGPTAAAKVVKNRIHPLKVTEDTTIEDACKRLVTMLGSTPPPWIKRILNKEKTV